jgi:hypothetical protein
MRRESSTVVALVGTGTVGPEAEPLLAELGRSVNISVVRPPVQTADPVESAALALSQTGRRASPFALVPADPLAGVATQWRAMWDVSHATPAGAVLFEEQVAHALAAWRAGRFELPDYYLVLTGIVRASPAGSPPAGSAPAGTIRGGTIPGASAPPARQTAPDPEDGPDFYLGPLRAVRPHRVAVVAATGGPEQAAWVRDALSSLRQGPWWPPLDMLLDSTRRFFAGGLAEAGVPLATEPR